MERRAGREGKAPEARGPSSVVSARHLRMGAPTVSLSSPVVVVVVVVEVVAASDLTLSLDDIRQNGHGKAIEIPRD